MRANREEEERETYLHDHLRDVVLDPLSPRVAVHDELLHGGVALVQLGDAGLHVVEEYVCAGTCKK